MEGFDAALSNAVQVLIDEVFVSKAEASAWLDRPHPMLSDMTPIDCCATIAGTERVRDILVALRYGGVV